MWCRGNAGGMGDLVVVLPVAVGAHAPLFDGCLLTRVYLFVPLYTAAAVIDSLPPSCSARTAWQVGCAEQPHAEVRSAAYQWWAMYGYCLLSGVQSG